MYRRIEREREREINRCKYVIHNNDCRCTRTLIVLYKTLVSNQSVSISIDLRVV